MSVTDSTEDKLRAQLREGHRLTDEEWSRRNTTDDEPLLSFAEIDRRDKIIAATAAEMERARIVAWLRKVAAETAMYDEMRASLRYAANGIERGEHNE